MCRIYLDVIDGSHRSHLELIGLILRLHGASVVNSLTDDVSHVVVSFR